MSEVHIAGVGIHPFGRSELSGLDQGVFAARQALADAGVAWRDIHFAFGGSSAAGSADAALPRLGLTGIQFINVANGCATGGSALLASYWAIKSGEFDLGLVLGFDKHPRGAFTFLPEDHGLPRWYGELGFMQTTQFFAMKTRRYMEAHGVTALSLARVVEKASSNAGLADHAWRREKVGVDVALQAPMVADPLTKYMMCSPSEGGVALVVASDRKMRELGLSGPRIRGAATRTRLEGSFEVFAPSLSISPDPSPTELAAKAAFEMAGVGPDEVSLAQLQDTDSGAEIMHMAENGFCADGAQEAMLADGDTRLGGRIPINTDGGCLACGEPIGATGLRQIYENVQQLRGRAGPRQVEGARIAYSQVYGMPGLSAVCILEA
jgi:acetyl-CoA acetyltransferase